MERELQRRKGVGWGSKTTIKQFSATIRATDGREMEKSKRGRRDRISCSEQARRKSQGFWLNQPDEGVQRIGLERLNFRCF